MIIVTSSPLSGKERDQCVPCCAAIRQQLTDILRRNSSADASSSKPMQPVKVVNNLVSTTLIVQKTVIWLLKRWVHGAFRALAVWFL